MSNININGRSAVHGKSEGKLMTIDICQTPSITGCTPVPYPNIAESKDTDMGCSSVKIQGKPACNVMSNFKQSKGDEAGTCGGLVSVVFSKMAEFITCSNNVMIEGKPAVRNADTMVSNMKNTPPVPLMQPPAGMAMAGKAKAPKKLENTDYSQKVDLSDFIGMNPETGSALRSLPFEFRNKAGEILLAGQTDRHGDTQSVETEKQENIVLYVGGDDWHISVY